MAALGPRIPIRYLRLAHGLSVAALVERIQAMGQTVHPDHIRNVELGHKRAGSELMTAWAHALGVTPLDVDQPKTPTAIHPRTGDCVPAHTESGEVR